MLTSCAAAENTENTSENIITESVSGTTDFSDKADNAADYNYMIEGLNAVAAFKEKIVCLDNMNYVENSEKIEVMSLFSDIPQISGQYTVNGIADYNELVKFMTEACTEDYARKLFDEKGFINHDGKIYHCSVDMLLDFYAYDESKIVSYEVNGNSVTYFCEANGTYDGGEPLDVLEYAFSVDFSGENPIISDCSYDGYCNYWLLCYTLSGCNSDTDDTAEAPDLTFDETDELLVKGRDFAKSYAKMSWLYLHGAAWDDYINIKYFDFDDKSEDNYFERDGIPFYKLLITDYTYGELIEYIKGFYTDEAFEELAEGSLKNFIAEKDNCIFVNGNEPTFLYLPRNGQAYIAGYTQNGDGTITYDFCAQSTEEENNFEWQYFSFTVTEDMKLTNDKFYESQLFLPINWINRQIGIESLVEPVKTSGLEVTAEELMPIIEAANYDMYFINGGDDIFTLKDGRYLNYGGEDFYSVLDSFYEVFAEESGIADKFISSLVCYKASDDLLIGRGNMPNYTRVDEDIFNIRGDYKKIWIDGGTGANPTFLSNEFEIINRTETTLTLKNTAYYNEENDNPVQVFEYDMVFEDGTWKFLNFEKWY